jgi:mRNA interferase MazF
VCGLTSDRTATPLPRVLIEPSPGNGLTNTSAVMVDKVASVPRRKLGARIGALSDAEMVAVNRSLIVFLGIAA